MKSTTSEEDARVREAYKTGGFEAAKAMRAEVAAGTNVPGPLPMCPTCGTDRIVRIPAGGKVVKIAAFGVFGLGDVHKIFRCLNCGYKW